MTTAFVLSGGGSLGAVQAGMLRALAEHEVTPDVLIGTSVGAINASWAAGTPGNDGAVQLCELWRGIRRQDIFPIRPLVGLRGFRGEQNYLFPNTGLRAVLRRHLTYTRLEDARVELRVVATEATSGQEVVLTTGDVVDAVCASAAIPGVFPSVRIDDHALVDGGLSNNTPIAHAVSSGATVVYVLPTGYACGRTQEPTSVLAAVIHSVSLLVQHRVAVDAVHYRDLVDLRVLPAPCPLDISPVDFSHSSELIDRAYQLATRALDERAFATSVIDGLPLHRH